MTLLKLLSAAAVLALATSPASNSSSLGLANNAAHLNQPIPPGSAVPITDTELVFTLPSPATVLIIGSVTFSLASGMGYVYPNLEIDHDWGGSHLQGHHFANTDSDDGESRPAVSATWVRVESLPAGKHSARLSMDVDPETSAWVFTAQVRAVRL